MALQSQGWAYVSCSAPASSNAGAQGPIGSLQFQTGSAGLSGSTNLIFNTGSSPNRLFLTGALIVNGDITATNFDVVNHTISYLSSSGDSKFGDSNRDIHQISGSLYVSRVTTNPPILIVTASTDQRVGILTENPVASFTLSGSYAINFVATTTHHEVAATDYFILAQPTGSGLEVRLPSAATAGRGRTIIVKLSGATGITVTPSAGESIDSAANSSIASSYGSETYVCNGTNAWFII